MARRGLLACSPAATRAGAPARQSSCPSSPSVTKSVSLSISTPPGPPGGVALLVLGPGLDESLASWLPYLPRSAGLLPGVRQIFLGAGVWHSKQPSGPF